MSGCEGYGCEPVFALAYIRHVNDHGRDLKLTYTSPKFEKALIEAGLNEPTRKRIIEQVMAQGSCQNIPEVPEHIQHAFVVSADITADEHVHMQAALQAFVDNSISKTCNFGDDATVEDVAQAYQLAWELGCKGLTVYVTGSRQKVVLETHATAEAKEPQAVAVNQQPLFYENKKPRPVKLRGTTYQVNTPVGKSFITINENGGNLPFEVFVSTAKAGSETFAVSEAIGRLISYILRIASPVNPHERITEIARQLTGIGGPRSLGFGPNRVRSLPDGVARALFNYLDDTQMKPSQTPQQPATSTGSATNDSAAQADQLRFRIGDLCPECGEAAIVNEEGCRKCYACGHSEC